MKKILIVVAVLVASIVLVVTIYNKKVVNKIENNYSEYVETLKNKKIFKKEKDKYIEIGNIKENMIIPLSYNKVKNYKDKYYQIKDTNYYIDYQDIKKTNLINNKFKDSYQKILTIKTNPTNLYKDNKLVLTINDSLELEIKMKKDENYYIEYFNDIYYIKDNYEIIKTEVNNLESIAILHFDKDIRIEKVEEVLNYLKENNYTSITLEDFYNWNKENIYLSDKKVLILYNGNLKIDDNFIINNNYNEKEFIKGDSKVKIHDSIYYQYDIYSTTSIERVKNMLEGIKEEINPNQKIAVLNYHFFYDSKIEVCNEIICLSTDNFKKQLNYLKENNYKTLTIEELNDWLDNKISLPERSVLITIDDGALGTSTINGNKLIPILEEYEINATLFLVTGLWDKANYQSKYLQIESHGDSLHDNNYCSNNKCGYKTLILSREELITDLKLSQEKLGTNLAFCYPFYVKNNKLVEVVKEAGFKLAFAGGNEKVTKQTDKYNIPRYVIHKDTSLNSFINMIK